MMSVRSRSKTAVRIKHAFTVGTGRAATTAGIDYGGSGMLTKETAVRSDAVWLADHLREADAKETWAATGLEPAVVLPQNFDTSRKVQSIFVDGVGHPIAIFGIAAGGMFEGIDSRTGEAWSLGRLGFPWMVATDELPAHGREFLRVSRDWLADLAHGYGFLCNQVWMENTTHIRWLQWLGFEFGKPYSDGPFDESFIPFSMKVSDIV